MNILEKYQLVIGLEVHAQLLTKSKLFCSDDTAFGADANTQVSTISLAHPGTLPVLNKQAVQQALKLGIALQCGIQPFNYFARKNYFYPDLPKGYQISQHTAPICHGGYVSIFSEAGEKKIPLNRIHMEEDAGKSIHDLDDNFSCIDLNRAGMPLVEIVTEPAIHSADDAFRFLTELRKILRWLEVCDGNMEEGSLRCDANISIRLKGDTKLGKRVEVKNLNSIRNVKRAIEIEFERLVALVENKQDITQETRSYDADRDLTFSLRSKEEAEDYRYFPEPDLPPFQLSPTAIEALKKSLPELPEARKSRFISQYGLSAYDAGQLCAEKHEADYFENLAKLSGHYKSVANWMNGPLRQYCNQYDLTYSSISLSSNTLAALINMVESGKVSFQNASGPLFRAILQHPDRPPEEMAIELNLIMENDEASLLQWIDEVIENMPEKVKEYKSGKKGLIGLFSGEVKKKSGGKADMQRVQQLLSEKLNQ